MVPGGVQDDTNTGLLARTDHVGELVSIAAAGVDLVRNGLVVEIPLITSDMFCGGRYLNVGVSYTRKASTSVVVNIEHTTRHTSGADEIGTFLCDTIPVPLE